MIIWYDKYEVKILKLMIINVRDEDKEKLVKCLVEHQFTPTHIASTGEFLQFGTSVLLLGLEEERVAEASALVSDYTKPSKTEGNTLKAEWYIINTKMLQK